MNSSESISQVQQIEFDNYLGSTKQQFNFLFSEENRRSRETSYLLAVYEKTKQTDLVAASILIPDIVLHANSRRKSDWLLTLVYDKASTLVGFRSVFVNFPPHPHKDKHNKEILASGGTIASLFGGVGIGSFTEMAHRQSLQLYANKLGQPIKTTITNGIQEAVREIEERYKAGIAGKAAYGEVQIMSARWSSLFGRGGNMLFSPQQMQKDSPYFYNVDVRRGLINGRRRYTLMETTPPQGIPTSLSRIGLGRKKIDFSRIYQSMS